MEEDENAGEEELEELMEDIEIEEEIHHEEKVRKKNAKVLLISIVGLVTIAGVYFGINYYNVLDEEEQLLTKAEQPQTTQLDKETLPLQEDLKKVKKKEVALPKAEVKKKDKNKPLPKKEAVEKKEPKVLKKAKKEKVKEPTVLEETKKEEIKEKVNPPKKPKKIKKVEMAKKQIKEKASTPLSLPSKDLKKSPVEKKSKPAEPSPIKTAKKSVPEITESGKYYIQFGQFVIKKNAVNLIRSLKNKGFPASKSMVKSTVNMYRVYAGKFSESKMAREAIIDLENEGINARLKSVTDTLYTIQTGSFYLKRNAEALSDKIAELGLITRTVRVPMTVDVNKVYIGYFKTRRNAALYQEKLAAQGFSETLILDS
tara:strand:+ start:1838 stop:2950 length:1113 start_codon:yes stop_codon:yes gene_type:complete